MNNELEPVMGYVGKKACGCIVAAFVCSSPKHDAQWASDLIREGLTLEFRNVAGVQLENHCPHEPQPYLSTYQREHVMQAKLF